MHKINKTVSQCHSHVPFSHTHAKTPSTKKKNRRQTPRIIQFLIINWIESEKTQTININHLLTKTLTTLLFGRFLEQSIVKKKKCDAHWKINRAEWIFVKVIIIAEWLLMAMMHPFLYTADHSHKFGNITCLFSPIKCDIKMGKKKYHSICFEKSTPHSSGI